MRAALAPAAGRAANSAAAASVMTPLVHTRVGKACSPSLRAPPSGQRRQVAIGRAHPCLKRLWTHGRSPAGAAGPVLEGDPPRLTRAGRTSDARRRCLADDYDP